MRILKYSSLKRYSKDQYSLPDLEEYEDLSLFVKEMSIARKNRLSLLEQKLAKSKAIRTPTNKYGKFEIVSREPTDPNKWRITSFANISGEEVPTGHVVCKTLGEGYDCVLDNLSFSDFNWGEWAKI